MVDDAGASPQARALAERFGARYEPHARPLGLNVARNTGVERSRGELVVFVDDDIRGGARLARGAARRRRRAPGRGRVHRARSGRAWRAARRAAAGARAPPITDARPRRAGHRRELRLGRQHGDPPHARWSASGRSTSSLAHGGDEQEWQERLRRRRRARASCTWPRPPSSTAAPAPTRGCARSARAAYARGRAARRFDARRGAAHRRSARELRTLAGCLGHVLRRRCPAGLTMVAHSAGRLREALRDAAAGAAAGTRTRRRAAEDFLSGTSGTVGGLDGCAAARSTRRVDAWELRQRQTHAAGAGRAARAAAAPRARARRASARSSASWPRDRARAAALPPRRRAAHLRRGRPRQVREPQPAAGRPPAGGPRLAAGGRRRRRAARAAFSTASCSCASASRWRSPSRPTACTRTPPGRSRAGTPAAWCARPASSRSAR